MHHFKSIPSRETLIKSVESPSGAKAPAWYQTFTDGLKAVPFKQLDLIRVSLASRVVHKIFLASVRHYGYYAVNPPMANFSEDANSP